MPRCSLQRTKIK